MIDQITYSNRFRLFLERFTWLHSLKIDCIPFTEVYQAKTELFFFFFKILPDELIRTRKACVLIYRLHSVEGAKVTHSFDGKLTYLKREKEKKIII